MWFRHCPCSVALVKPSCFSCAAVTFALGVAHACFTILVNCQGDRPALVQNLTKAGHLRGQHALLLPGGLGSERGQPHSGDGKDQQPACGDGEGQHSASGDGADQQHASGDIEGQQCASKDSAKQHNPSGDHAHQQHAFRDGDDQQQHPSGDGKDQQHPSGDGEDQQHPPGDSKDQQHPSGDDEDQQHVSGAVAASIGVQEEAAIGGQNNMMQRRQLLRRGSSLRDGDFAALLLLPGHRPSRTSLGEYIPRRCIDHALKA